MFIDSISYDESKKVHSFRSQEESLFQIPHKRILSKLNYVRPEIEPLVRLLFSFIFYAKYIYS